METQPNALPKPYLKRRCTGCGKYTLQNAFYSEDYAAVFDQDCPECGTKARAYIGANDSRATFERVMAKWPLEAEVAS
jgi:hypothetical protein